MKKHTHQSDANAHSVASGHATTRRLRQIRRGLGALFLAAVAATLTHAQDPIPGSFDLSFGGGTGKIGNLAVGTSHDSGRAVALQPDGKIVLTGDCRDGTRVDFCVARLNADGTLDATFNGPSGTNGNGKFLLPIGVQNDYAYTLALQPDGKIVLGGGCSNILDFDFCITRLNTDGSFDASFVGPNGNGKFLLPIGTNDDVVGAIALQPDGKIVLAGTCSTSSVSNFCVARLNADGTPDTSFSGPDGNGSGRFLLPSSNISESARALALQADGKIVIAGDCGDGINQDFCVVRLNADGTLDLDFDGPSGIGNGKFSLAIGTGSDSVRAVTLQPDSKIVLVGGCQNAANGTNDFCVARLNPNGALDATFGGASANGTLLLPVSAGYDYAYAVALQADGKILLAGDCESDFCAARLNPDGSLDTSFDGPTGIGNGKVVLPIGTGLDLGRSVAIQPNGMIVLAGQCSNGANIDFCVARLHGGPFGAKQCSFDLDGDGKVFATTDMLIGTRVALGMTGSTVLNGITFAAHAARKTWPEIRTFLVSQCGMAIAP
ncbi:MAG: hypothetical protein KA260_03370 [Burkholderiales bacterium]|nr:hypothetical protein [Burkholderiales bacterium]